MAYNTSEPFTLADAVEEFFSQVVAVPPGKWNPACRWEPQDEAETVNEMPYRRYYCDNCELNMIVEIGKNGSV